MKKRQAEEAEERRLAEEQRKQQEQGKRKKHKCIQFMSRDSLAPCVYNEDAIIVQPTVDMGLAKLLLKGGMEVLGATDVLDCFKNPSLGKCTLAAAGVLPVGKLKLLKKGAEGIEDIAKSSRAGRVIKCATCFLAGTKILMADASAKSIESVKIGDRVVSTDPATGKTEQQEVSDLIITDYDKSFNELDIATDRGANYSPPHKSTPSGPRRKKKWVEASDLRAGMTLQTADGSAAAVQSNTPFTKRARTYNLTVDSLHTYYVFAGHTPVLVHNDILWSPRILHGFGLGHEGSASTRWFRRGSRVRQRDWNWR